MTQTVTAAVATRDRSDQLVSWIRRQQDDIAMAAASHVKPSAIIRVTQGALRRDDKLLAAAIANPQSLLYALLDCARLGHEPDTDDYYLVPFGQEVTGIEGYKGIIERMFRAGGVTSVVAQVVRKSDRYAPRGENTPPLHEYDDFASADERGPMRGAYAYAIFTSGHCSQVIRMGRAEIMEHKAASRGSGRSDSPWQKWEPAMWKKTVLRGLEPYVPTSNEFRTAPAKDQREGMVYLPPPPMGPLPADEIVEAEIVDDPPPSNGENDETPAGAVPDETPASGPAAPAGPARATSGQLSMLGQRLGKLGVGDENRIGTLEKLAGRDLEAAGELTQDEAARIRGLLDRCRGDRGALVELLATGQLPEAEKTGDGDE
jgi:recombination protein RecT